MTNPGDTELTHAEMKDSTITFQNNGKSTTIEDYSNKGTVKEIIRINRVESMVSMRSVTVSNSLQIVDISSDTNVLGVSKLRDAITEAYTYNTNSSTTKSRIFTKESDAEFVVNEHIEISPCSEHKVSSYINMVRGYTMDYVIYAMVRGSKGRRSMTAEELKDELVGMEYIRDLDENIIVAKGNGTIAADFGVETVVKGLETVLSGCRE